MFVEYVSHMGTDESVADAARVSFAKAASNYTEEENAKLISYLARHEHWSPFSHVYLKFWVKAPIFVARQLAKHQVGCAWNEVSRRYVDSAPEFYVPDGWRARAANVKQGSSAEFVNDKGFGFSFSRIGENTVSHAIERHLRHTKGLYEDLLDHGVCPEQARMVLPQSMYTEWVWSGSLYYFARMCKQRLDSHTQKETREIAEHVAKFCKQHFPVSWEALIGDK